MKKFVRDYIECTCADCVFYTGPYGFGDHYDCSENSCSYFTRLINEETINDCKDQCAFHYNEV